MEVLSGWHDPFMARSTGSRSLNFQRREASLSANRAEKDSSNWMEGEMHEASRAASGISVYIDLIKRTISPLIKRA